MRRTLLLSLLLGLSACGISRDGAREQATRAACDRYAECEGFGENKTYADRDDCEVAQASFWNNHWPNDRCEGAINGEGFDDCLKAIDITDCRNGLDVLNTALNKCSADQVCGG